jgi:hypothetical protein
MSSESNPLRPEVASKGLDFRAIGYAVWQPFILWAAAVIVVAFFGRQPGVVCVTPVAWFMACWVGLTCVSRSRSGQKAARLTEAGLAGAILGLLQGLLFAAFVSFIGIIRPDERQKAVFMILAMIVLGTVVSAVLSIAVGAAQDRRRTVK